MQDEVWFSLKTRLEWEHSYKLGNFNEVKLLDVLIEINIKEYFILIASVNR